MARPTKYSTAIAKAIAERIRIGCSFTAAAEASGICYDTFRDWYERGREAKSGERRDFFELISEARADCEARFTAVVAKAAGGWEEVTAKTIIGADGRSRTEITKTNRFEPQMALAYLKSHCPEWRDHVKQEISGPDGGPVSVAILSEEQRKARVAALLAAAEARDDVDH